MKPSVLLSMILILVTMSISYAQENAGTVTYMGKTYNLVKIGTQTWFKENLNAGTRVVGSQNQTNNNIIEQYYFYDDGGFGNNYGGLYQWNEAMQYSTTPKVQGVCPPGFHIPSKAEFEKLIQFAQNNPYRLLISGPTPDANSTGFSAKLSGYRMTSSPYFVQDGTVTLFWTSDQTDDQKAYQVSLRNSAVIVQSLDKNTGASIRPIKDSVTVGISDEVSLPNEYSLSQNYPNPFNNETIIKYSIANESKVIITVSDILGRNISTLVNTTKPMGNYSVSFRDNNLPSGTYICTIKTNTFTKSIKMLLLK